MKRMPVVAAFAAVLGALLAAALIISLTAGSDSSSEDATITVSAAAEGQVEPDVITMSFGVEAEGSNAGEALDASSAAMRRVMASIEKHGVADRDIQTQFVDVSAVYSEDGRTGKYLASNSVRVKLRQIAEAGELISDATAAGANLQSGLSFSLEDEDATYQRALNEALDKARLKASALAERAGVDLGDPVSIEEVRDGGNEPLYSYRATDAAAEKATPVEPGRIEIGASVTVVYSVS